MICMSMKEAVAAGLTVGPCIGFRLLPPSTRTIAKMLGKRKCAAVVRGTVNRVHKSREVNARSLTMHDIHIPSTQNPQAIHLN